MKNFPQINDDNDGTKFQIFHNECLLDPNRIPCQTSAAPSVIRSRQSDDMEQDSASAIEKSSSSSKKQRRKWARVPSGGKGKGLVKSVNVNSDIGFSGGPDYFECNLCHCDLLVVTWVKCQAGCIFCTPCFTKRFHDQLSKNVTNTDCFLKCGELFSKENLKKYLAPVFYEKLMVKENENEPDIFKKLEIPPDEVRGAIRIYNMKPKNDTNFANPLDILYIAAEGTFLRMFKGRGGQGLDRNFIKGIKYIENETLAKRFNNSKRRLEAQGIMCKERLVFHRTPHHKNVEPIFQNGLLLSKFSRFAHGYGIYFSEFPDVSQLYGQHLLLCRVLVGRYYNEGRDIGGNIPPGYNSKFMAPDKNGKASERSSILRTRLWPSVSTTARGGWNKSRHPCVSGIRLCPCGKALQ